MRADMGKVLVERPRGGSRKRHFRQKGSARTLARDIDAGRETAREGISVLRGDTTRFSEHLGPLRRFLHARTGRHWDAVYAELSEHIDRGNLVQKHVLTHLFQYVEVNAVLMDGIPHHPQGHRGRPLPPIRGRDQWYVCPKSGILKRAKSESNAERRARWSPPPPKLVLAWVGKNQFCRKRPDGGWELVAVKRFPPPPSGHRVSGWNTAPDVIHGTLHRQEARALYGREVVAVEVRRLTAAEVKSLPIPIDLLRTPLSAPNVVR